MSARECWKMVPLLTLAAFLAAGCNQTTPTAVDADATQTTIQDPVIDPLASVPPINELRRDVLRRYEDELWPCPAEFEPILMEEFVPSTPPLKPPGHPDYWDQCPATPGHFTNHNSSIGSGTHVGTFTNEWDSCLDVVNRVGFFDAVLTAANGDQLNWEITAEATPLPGGELYFETTDVTFDGGTGRFVDAAGYAAGAGNTIGEGEHYYYIGCLAY
jgi:hypothetical protein